MARTRKVTSIKEEIIKQEEAVAKSKEKYDAEVEKAQRFIRETR